MDNPIYILLGILVLALIIGGPLLKGWANRKAAEAGERAGKKFAAGRLAPVLAEFGTTLVIEATPEIAKEIVDEAASAKSREVTMRADGGYGIRFAETDDTIVRLVTDPAGVRVQVDTFREYLGFPQTAPLWVELRTRISEDAAVRGVRVIEGPRVEHLRGLLIDPDNARWTLDA